MQNPARVLAQIEEFLNGLRDYYRIYDSQEEYDRARELAGRLRVLYGQLGPPFTELGVTREYEILGNRYPVFETALGTYDPITGDVVGQALDIAIAVTEVGIGTLRGRIERGEAEDPPLAVPAAPAVVQARRRSFWYAWLIVGLTLGWLGGHFEISVIALFRSDSGLLYGKIVFVAILFAVAGVSANLLASIVHESGWRKGASEHRGWFWTYLVLTLVCGIWATIATASKPESPKPPETAPPAQSGR